MHLNQKECESYYCAQVGGGGGVYFQGIPHQRGYGFFGDLRRYITPLALRAGRYLGKQLMQTGKNVLSDVAAGSSFKDSARSRIRQDNLLSAGLFAKDTASKHDVVGDENEGYTTRANRCKLSQSLDLVGPLHFDLATQPKLLVNGVNVRIKLERHKDVFTLMSANDNYKIRIQLAKLYVRKVSVAPSILIAHEKALEKGVIKMPIRRIDIKSFAISSGLQSTTIANAFIGQLPTRLILGFVSNAAYNGSINRNPFKFHHYNLNYLCILNGGQMIPSKPYQPNFEKTFYGRSYLSIFTDLNRYHSSPNINISFDEYKDGYTLYAVDLTPDMASNESHVSINKSGNIAIDIKFAAALPETVTLIVYAEYRNIIEIDKSRGVTTDY
ncbi:uncharacterized protein F54H12.2-like [Stegodyphus dumicola]|uniref:uncharacterized protein F54H12.2-like n=1 Tax=Stegodyphus dumicola TaxID=202533 RepID=UPI0015B11A9E|nr:uncharacterized protein F54H12.2-like [Stegodyphus dumicola]